jgi:alkylation response protein AidB-like acyl-CoA dehydrogenase
MSLDTSDIRDTAPENVKPEREVSFAETAMRLGNKSEDEARRMGAVDSADEQVERLFAPEYQTVNSPIHRAVWDRVLPVELFQGHVPAPAPEVERVMTRSLDVIRRRKKAGQILDSHRKVSEETLSELGDAGYWGLLVSPEYGGSGAAFVNFAKFLTRMATLDPTVAGLASVHGCIGAVDPVRSFGSEEQKQRFLPKLASGETLSAFALTEPNAGSDLTALRTTAVLDGDEYVVNGEKLFITNVRPGRTIGLVCLIDNEPAVLIVDLPKEENEHFQLKKYGLYALQYAHNYGILFKDFRVPAENLLEPVRGDGLTIAYHGLNLGRVALCANAAGTMRMMLASILPWAWHRKTYGEPIAKRELVLRRMGRMAGLIVASDAMTEWCGSLLDAGFRGEMECIIAKIFGSEAQKEATIELLMKTHGGRAFLKGHLFGDNAHDFLAPCIYEGEGEMLGMAFFKSLVKHHGKMFFEPIGKTLHAHGIKKPNLANPAHAWKLKGPLMNYAGWLTKERLTPKSHSGLGRMPGNLRKHAEFAIHQLQSGRFEISATMRKHQLKLADRQCRMAALSQELQDAVVMLCTSLYAARQEDELTRLAAETICQSLKLKLTGGKPTDRDFRKLTELGTAIADGGFGALAGIEPEEILMNYKND